MKDNNWICANTNPPLKSGNYICQLNTTNNVEIIAFLTAEDDEPSRWLDAPDCCMNSYPWLTDEQKERARLFNRVILWQPMPQPRELK